MLRSTRYFFITYQQQPVAKMDEIVNNSNGEIQPLPAKPQFSHHANTNYFIMMWLHENATTTTRTRFLIPAVWRLLEERIREYPNEAREVDEDGNLPIHRVLYASEAFNKSTAAPLSLVRLLIEIHPDGLHFRDDYGRVPLHWAVDHPCIDCFRVVLFNLQ
jgi:ankyrin repeat protein